MRIYYLYKFQTIKLELMAVYKFLALFKNILVSISLILRIKNLELEDNFISDNECSILLEGIKENLSLN